MGRLRKNDTVVVVTGKDKGKKGKILRVVSGQERFIIEGINLVKKHLRPTRDNPQGGIANLEGSIHRSNVMLVCPRCSKKTKVGFTVLTDGSKKRICKQCSEII